MSDHLQDASDSRGGDEIFKDVNTYDKTLMEKLKLIDELEGTKKKSLYNIIDSLIAKKRLKDNLQSLVKG